MVSLLACPLNEREQMLTPDVLGSLGESDCNFQFLMENEFKDSTPQEKNTPFESGVSSDVAGLT